MLREIKDKVIAKGKAIAGLVTCAVASASTAVCVLAAEGSGTVTANDFNSVVNGVTNQVSVSTVVGVLASIVGVCIGLVFMWWGLRKVIRMIMSAWRGGRMSV